jgi:putative membrane protein
VLYLTAKAVHIVGFISWFGGLFYLVRLFVYHAEAGDKPEPERSILRTQLQTMQARLWKIITLPAMAITFAGGITMLAMIWPGERWLHYKFVWLALLVAYNFACGRILRQQAAGTSTWTSARLRVFNEGATLLMAAIVFLAVFRSSMSAIWGALGLLGLGIALMVGIRVYRRIRASSEPSAT